MRAVNQSFVRSSQDLDLDSAHRHRFAQAGMTALYWLRDAFCLMATATLLAWLVVKFSH